MGIIKSNLHDVFFSYAHDDNDLYDNYVAQFYKHFRRKFMAEMGARNKPKEKIDFFIDKYGMPANGLPSKELMNDVENSVFLFVFLSRNYLNSDFCKEELKWFEQCYSGSREQAVEHLFIILLEGEAKDRCWGGFLDKTERPLYEEFFEGDTLSPIQIFLREDKLHPNFNRKLDKLVRALAKRAEGMIQEEDTIPMTGFGEPPLELIAPDAPIALGIVTEDLGDVKSKLSGILKDANRPVLEVTVDDLVRGEIGKKLETCQLLVQPFSFAPVIFPQPDEPGGHLSFQQKFLRQGVRTVWWRPEGESGVIDAHEQDQAEKNRGNIDYLLARDREALRETPAGLVESLTDQPTLVRPSVFIESRPPDQEISWQLQRQIKTIWKTRFPEEPPLGCYAVEAENLENLIKKRGHGIILTFGSKEVEILFDQVDMIDSELEILNRDPERAIAVIPPNECRGPLLWSTFGCKKDDGDLEIVESDIINILEAVKRRYRGIAEARLNR